jgi:hypothetical protein
MTAVTMTCFGCHGPIEPGMATYDWENTQWHQRCALDAKAELFAKAHRYWGRWPWLWGRKVLDTSDIWEWGLKYLGDGEADGPQP